MFEIYVSKHFKPSKPKLKIHIPKTVEIGEHVETIIELSTVNGTPIRGAKIEVYTNNELSCHAVTDSSGKAVVTLVFDEIGTSKVKAVYKHELENASAEVEVLVVEEKLMSKLQSETTVLVVILAILIAFLFKTRR